MINWLLVDMNNIRDTFEWNKGYIINRANLKNEKYNITLAKEAHSISTRSQLWSINYYNSGIKLFLVPILAYLSLSDWSISKY